MDEIQKNPLAQKFNTFSIIKFALPTIIMMLFMGVYTIVDTIFVARFVDTNALSAINIVCPVINIIVGLGTMLATGGSAVVAKKMGSGKNNEARSNLTLIILAGVVIGMLVTTFGLLFIDEIIWGLGASETLFPYCKDYITILLVFATANIMQVLVQALFVTAGKPSLGFILAIFAGIANIVFDYVFIVLLQMGIKGAAIGTSIGYMIPTVAGIVFFLHKKGELFFGKPTMDFSALFHSCSNGVSEMISQLSTAVTTFLFNISIMRLLGEDGVAAITIIIYSQFLLTTLYIGFSMGVAPIISYNHGGQNTEQLKKIFKTCLYFIATISVVVFLFSFFAGKSIVQIFAGNNQNVFDITKLGFIIFSFSFLFCGFNIFASALFTSLSNGKVSAIISFLRTFGFILIALLILPQFLQVTGIWLAVPIAEFLTLNLTIWLIYRHRKEYQYF